MDRIYSGQIANLIPFAEIIPHNNSDCTKETECGIYLLHCKKLFPVIDISCLQP